MKFLAAEQTFSFLLAWEIFYSFENTLFSGSVRKTVAFVCVLYAFVHQSRPLCVNKPKPTFDPGSRLLIPHLCEKTLTSFM
jgi:hypothetical protein